MLRQKWWAMSKVLEWGPHFLRERRPRGRFNNSLVGRPHLLSKRWGADCSGMVGRPHALSERCRVVNGSLVGRAYLLCERLGRLRRGLVR